MLNDFFEQLANYYYLENDLSNVTVALCNSNEFFKGKFIKFFFPAIDVDEIVSIEREIPDKKGMGSRVDILIKMNDEKLPYLIEVKIGDKNHHFGQYEKAYDIPKERLGYITNYDCVEGKKMGYDVKSWEEFYRYLSSVKTADVLIHGYLRYLARVCGILDIKQKLLLSDEDFKDKVIGIFSSLCMRKTDRLNIKRRNRFDRDTFKMVDFFYGYNPNEDKWPYFATLEFNYADRDSPFIRLFVSKSSNKEAYNMLNSSPILAGEGRTFEKGVKFVWFGQSYGFHLKSKLFNVLESPEDQIELLQNFMDEVLMRLKPMD